MSSSSRLPAQFRDQSCQTGDVAAGPCKTLYKTGFDRIDPLPVMMMGIILVVFSVPWIHGSPPATTMISTLRRTNSAAISGSRSSLSLGIAVLNGDGLPVDVTQLAQSLSKYRQRGRPP